MVRPDRKKSLTPEQIAALSARMQEAGRALESIRPALGALAEAVHTATGRIYRSLRRTQWAQQYPMYACPYVTVLWSVNSSDTTRCDLTWDRREISTEELRMEVFDHLTRDHLPGENGLLWAGKVVSRIKEKP